MNTTNLLRGSSLWYPVMLAQERGELSESRAAELLALSINDYREQKHAAVQAVARLVTDLPSPLKSLAEVIMKRPDLLG
jgi:hypothetical protein